MATLRNLIDGRSLDCTGRSDVFKHLEKAHRQKVKSDLANTKLQVALAPTRKLLELSDQMHPAPGQQNNVDQNGNPVNLQNPQLGQNGQPIPNQAPPVRPGIGQPNAQKNNQQTQKKSGFPIANKTSTKDKLATDKENKTKAKGKGIEVHVKAGSKKIDQLNVKKKKLRANDYHDTPQLSQMPSRGIGLSSSRKRY